MTTAFVLSGGASLGSLQVGMLQALLEHGIQPDFVVGTSAGAINAAYFSKHPNLEGVASLAKLWKEMKRTDVFPIRPALGFLGFVGQRDHLCPAGPVLSLLQRQYGKQRLEDSAVPAHVIAADLASGKEVCISTGNSAQAVLASASLPGIFPPVNIDGRFLIDGGVINNAPISHAVRLGATTVYVLTCGHACALAKPPKGALGVLLQSVSVLIGRQLVHDVDRFEPHHDLRIVPQTCPQNVAPMDFSQASKLIANAHSSTSAWLDQDIVPSNRHGQSILIDPHTH
jgi:NTE family protein